MEASAAGVAARGVALPMTSSATQPSRKQWRAVPEHSGRNSSNGELERVKLGQSDERLIYEQGREPADVDFCSITIEGGSDNDILQQRLHSVVKQKEELQQMEIELRAQLIARTEILEMQNEFEAQIKEHANANVKLQEQLHEREMRIHELERKMEEKERELHAIRLDNEAAWAKEDLLREQSKELQTYRRDRDNSEAERAQHIKQMHELQEHIQEKERQFMELQEQHRIAQETIVFKDEHLREAQAWISRVQEMDVLQSTTNHKLQADLRERTEQYNQLWLGCQHQYAEMERFHLHIQQLQLELAEARERSGSYSDASRVGQTNTNDVSQLGQNNGGQAEASENGTPGGNSVNLPNGSAEHASSFVSGGNSSTQNDHVHGVQMAPSSLLGVPSYLPPGQVTPLHPFVMHQQGVPHSVPSPHVSHFHSVPAMSALQQWQSQQVASDGSHLPTQSQYLLQTDPTMLRPESNYYYETSVNGQIISPENVDVNTSQSVEATNVVPSSNEQREVFETMDKNYVADSQSQQSMQQISSQFQNALRLDPLEHSNMNKEKNLNHFPSQVAEAPGLMPEQPVANSLQSEEPNHAVHFSNTTVNASSAAVLAEAFSSTGQRSHYVIEKPAEIPLLDERSLLACIVRTIPPGTGGRIRISSTLPNRLTKMLAPLHWHDYKKMYGKLDEFVGSHPELFLVEGDFIQLREGAQEILAATAAVAKVAAAAAAASTHSSLLHSVAVTPMAQSHRSKKVLSVESTSVKSGSPSRLLAMQNPQPNGVTFTVPGDVSNIKFVSKQQGRTIGAATSSRR